MRRVYADCHPYKQAMNTFFGKHDPAMLEDTIDRPADTEWGKANEDAYFKRPDRSVRRNLQTAR